MPYPEKGIKWRVESDSSLNECIQVYYYHYTYRGSPSAFDNRWGLDMEDRPAHSEEYVREGEINGGSSMINTDLHSRSSSCKFQCERLRNSGGFFVQTGSINKQYIQIFSKVFADFVNKGDPTPEGRKWSLYEENERNYFEIGIFHWRE